MLIESVARFAGVLGKISGHGFIRRPARYPQYEAGGVQGKAPQVLLSGSAEIE